MTFKRKLLIGILIFAVIVGVVTVISVNYYREKSYTVRVTEKTVKNYEDGSKFLIFTKTEDGKIRTFRLEDNLWVLQFDSADKYAEIEIGQTYNFTVIGWRIPFFSAYENIVGIEKK